MTTTDDLFDNLINSCKKPGDLVGENSLLSQLFRTAPRSAQQNGMSEHQGKNIGIIANHLQDKT